MFEPAHMPILLAQVTEITGFSEGLSKGGLYFITSVLAFAVWFLYREVREWQGKYLALVEKNSEERIKQNEKHNEEILSVVKENTPAGIKLADAVIALDRLTTTLTRAD